MVSTIDEADGANGTQSSAGDRGDPAEVWDRAGVMRMVRRHLDLSQRELAERLGVSHSTIHRAESHSEEVSLGLVEAVLKLGGYRLAVVGGRFDEELRPEPIDVARDNAGRRYPAHLDARGAESTDAPLGSWRPDRPEPQVTFDQRHRRGARRAVDGVTPYRHPTAREIRRFHRRDLDPNRPISDWLQQYGDPEFVPDDWVPEEDGAWEEEWPMPDQDG